MVKERKARKVEEEKLKKAIEEAKNREEEETRKREDEELKCREAERRGQELEAQIKNLVEQESNKCLTLTENVKQLEVTNRELREQMKANENRMKEYENKIAIAESNQEEFKSLKTKEMVKERKAVSTEWLY